MTAEKLEALVRDIEMSYEVLAAFLAVHGDDPDCDEPAAWEAARRQVATAIRAATRDA